MLSLKKSQFDVSFERINTSRGEHYYLEVNEEKMMAIREWAMDALQTKGFDKNYELTAIGMTLESIFDKFFVE